MRAGGNIGAEENIEWVREKERTGNVWNFPMWSNTMFTCDTVANLRSKHWTLSLAHDIRACTWGRSNSISLSCELELVYASSFHLFRISLLHLFHLMAFQSLSLTTESHNIRTYKKLETCTVNSANSSCLLSSTFDRIKKNEISWDRDENNIQLNSRHFFFWHNLLVCTLHSSKITLVFLFTAVLINNFFNV